MLPKHPITLHGLIDICQILGDEDEASRYRRLLDTIKAGFVEGVVTKINQKNKRRGLSGITDATMPYGDNEIDLDDLFENLTRIDIDDPESHFETGRSLIDQGQNEAGMEYIAISGLIDKNGDVTDTLWGEYLIGRGNLEDAVEVLSKAIKRNPANLLARKHLGVIFISPRIRDYASAIPLLEEGLSLEGGTLFLFPLGIAYVGEERYRDATRVLDKLSEVNQEQADLLSEEIRAARMGRPGQYIKNNPGA